MNYISDYDEFVNNNPMLNESIYETGRRGTFE